MSKSILVTGGLGFIGSHTVVELITKGYEPIIIDNLSNSTMSVLNGIEEICLIKPVFYNMDVNDKPALDQIFKNHTFDAVIHFAAYKAVGESVEKPLIYYRNNVGGMMTLLEVMELNKCRKIVFSSSCTVYGQPEELPVSENSPIVTPGSPYGNTKKICEEILKDCEQFSVVSLRYFNPIGAHPSSLIGELPLGTPNNLIPFITQTAVGIRHKLTVHGSDYNTIDGTCVRDYLHVCDLADAHIHALERIENENFGIDEGWMEIYNLGTGKGYSVKQVIDCFEKVSGKKLPHVYGPRRPGDVEQVWANPKKANLILGWTTKRNLKEMLDTAWKWQLKLQGT